MKRQLIIALLASAILASCSKEDTITPYSPYEPPDISDLPNQAPYGIVDAPFVVVSLLDYSGAAFKMEKYRADGSARADLLDDYFGEGHFIDNPDFSPKGDILCYGENNAIYLLDVISKQQLVVLNNAGAVESTELSPDGIHVAYLNWNSDFTLDLNLVHASGESNPQKLTNFENSGSSAGPPSFSPDGNMIVYSEYPDIVVYDLNSASKRTIYHTSTERYFARYPIFNKDGAKLIYIVTFESAGDLLELANVNEVDIETPVVLANLTGAGISGASWPVLSEDGNTVYFVGTAAGITNLYKVPVTGGAPVRVAFNIDSSEEFMVVGLDFVER